MDAQLPRREFLRSASALGLGAGLAGSAALHAITPARAGEMVVSPDIVRFRPEIEPIVRWIEDTPREKALEVALDHLKNGLSYRDLMGALFLAGIRNIKPRPVGFKFHAVMVINSAHLLGQTAAVEDRLLPMFWALDNFKSSQAQDVKEGDWTLETVDESHVPSPSESKDAFVRAMDAWDYEAADTAIAGLCRTSGAAEVMEPLWRYAVRDHRNIGHKAIFAAQSWRTLQAIGWQHAEPVVRSLIFGMLDLQGDRNKEAVGPYRVNLENSKKIRNGWQIGKPDASATVAFLETLRQASPEEASAEAVSQLNNGISPDSLWDAVILAGNEMLLKKPGIVPLHAITSSNALHFIYGASGDETTRKLALLQACGWQPLFRSRAGDGTALKIDALTVKPTDASGADAVTEIFSTAGKDRTEAAYKAMGYFQNNGSPEAVYAAARKLIFRKGRDSHDYKYGAAIWEEYRLASDPKWQAPLTAAALAFFPASTTADSPLMRRARDAAKEVLGSSA
jgi:hypothetical protein